MDSSTTINDNLNGKSQSSEKAANNSKVGTWLSEFVGEVRKKSHNKFQKWSGSVCNDNLLTDEINTNIGIDINDTKPSLEDSCSFTRKSEENIWTKLRLDQLTSTEKSKIFKVENIGQIGKLKITELYDKIKYSSSKYNFVPVKRFEKDFMEATNSENSTGNNLKENYQSESRQNLKCLSSSQNNEENYLPISRKLRDIGRTNTVFSESSIENDSSSTLWRPIPKTMKHLRSFSVSEHNENTDIFDNEMENNNLIDINKSIAITNNVVSSSLPNFMPISPIIKNASSKDIGVIGDVPRRKSILFRDSSIQSDSSHCSSVESLLEARKPDPEAILLNLGFGPIESEDILTRIPKRFLKPSQVRGIDTDAFLRRQQLASHLHDHSVLGYRGLLGNPDIPPSTIVAKIMERFELNERNRCIMDINMNRPQSAPPTHGDIQ